jgi:hypothetical protein
MEHYYNMVIAFFIVVGFLLFVGFGQIAGLLAMSAAALIKTVEG